VRLATLLRTTPESWLRMQQAVDLWEVRQQRAKELAEVKPLERERLQAVTMKEAGRACRQGESADCEAPRPES
jgi:plasmid maintenance system antidote protein VapI